MNEDQNTPAENQTDQTRETKEPEATPGLDELGLLKERARTMGIPVKGNVGIETLKKNIAEKLSRKTSEPEPEVNPVAQEVKETPVVKTKAQMEQETRERLRVEELALVRCKIYNLNPGKRDLQGEIITVRNKYLGTVRKFIPFGEATDGGYHIPRIIYNDLKTRKFQSILTKRVKGQEQVTTRMVPEYSLDVLPMLTREELSELALNQAAAERVGSE